MDGLGWGFGAELVELKEGIRHQGEDAGVLTEVEVDLRTRAGASLIADGEGVADAGSVPLRGLAADFGVAVDRTDGGASGGGSVGGGLAADKEKREKRNDVRIYR